MRGADLINALLPDELLDEVLRRVGAKRDLDACALVCRRWRLRERACRRAAKLLPCPYRTKTNEVLRVVVDLFPALAEVSVDERLTYNPGGWCWAPALREISLGKRLPAAANSAAAASSRRRDCCVGDQSLIAIGKGCKLLSDLNLRRVGCSTNEGLVGLVQNCGRSLVSLGITAGAWMTDTSCWISLP